MHRTMKHPGMAFVRYHLIYFPYINCWYNALTVRLSAITARNWPQQELGISQCVALRAQKYECEHRQNETEFKTLPYTYKRTYSNTERLVTKKSQEKPARLITWETS
jgi:hypothetical protein